MRSEDLVIKGRSSLVCWLLKLIFTIVWFLFASGRAQLFLSVKIFSWSWGVSVQRSQISSWKQTGAEIQRGAFRGCRKLCMNLISWQSQFHHTSVNKLLLLWFHLLNLPALDSWCTAQSAQNKGRSSVLFFSSPWSAASQSEVALAPRAVSRCISSDLNRCQRKKESVFLQI